MERDREIWGVGKIGDSCSKTHCPTAETSPISIRYQAGNLCHLRNRDNNAQRYLLSQAQSLATPRGRVPKFRSLGGTRESSRALSQLWSLVCHLHVEATAYSSPSSAFHHRCVAASRMDKVWEARNKGELPCAPLATGFLLLHLGLEASGGTYRVQLISPEGKSASPLHQTREDDTHSDLDGGSRGWRSGLRPGRAAASIRAREHPARLLLSARHPGLRLLLPLCAL